ncbi:SUMF1/EgtB/PvdO family nonheme iron enzyme, partial [Acidobacteriota bacterium]
EGTNLKQIIKAILTKEPVLPRSKNQKRKIPPEVEKICLKAMRKNPKLRYQSAKEFGEAIRSFLESEEEEHLWRQKSRDYLKKGMRLTDQYSKLKMKFIEIEDNAEEIAIRFKSYDSLKIKRPYYQVRERTRQLKQQSVELFSKANNALTDALALKADNQEARSLLADLYFDKYKEAENAGQIVQRELFRNLVERYHDGKYGEQLYGTSGLCLHTNPPGARVILSKYVETDLILTPTEPRDLGITPIKAQGLGSGSYLIEILHDEFRTCKYPILLERGTTWEGKVNLYTEEEIGKDFTYIPAGPFISGGDLLTQGSEDRKVRYLNDYFIMERHITQDEYLAFINELDKKNSKKADKRIPRWYEGHPYWCRDQHGRYTLPPVNLPDDFMPDWPVMAISIDDFLCYLKWRSKIDDRYYYLPTSDEWEKAARGVDGRMYPWGCKWDDTFCNIQSSKAVTDPSAVKNFFKDYSPYGMYDSAGNMHDLCRDRVHGKRDNVLVRGGTWIADESWARIANRGYMERTAIPVFASIRLVHYPRIKNKKKAIPGNRSRTHRFYKRKARL